MKDSNAQPNNHGSDAGYIESDEEARMAEKELAENAQWKIFQKNTFTRWANEHLKKADMVITNLESDLSDGIRLAALVEVLSKHKFRHINKRPTFRTQKLENVTTVLKFLEESEGIRLISIDSSHIVDSNLKLILGLMWALILHYSISVPMWDGEEEPQDTLGQGPKQRLLGWVRQKLPLLPVNNFTTDWNSGIAIGALVDSCAPGLCPDWTDWDARKPLRNATEAMNKAEDWLSVPQLIKPEEMVDKNVDEKAMMTYLSQFPNAQLKEGAPLKPKTNPSLVRAYGPGLESEVNRIGESAIFTIDTAKAGLGELEILIINPRGSREPCEVTQSGNEKYTCVYKPNMEGEYRIVVKFAGHELASSPYVVNIKGARADPTKVTVNGPGIQTSELNCIGRRTYFNVLTHNAGQGDIDCVIIDPQGRRNTIKPRITCSSEDSSYVVEYAPNDPGLHTIIVQFAGVQIPNSPFLVEITPNTNPGLAFATGRGVQSRGIRVHDQVNFSVHTEQAGDPALLTVSLVRPDGQLEKCDLLQVDKYLWTCSYSPQFPGKYTLDVRYNDGPIQNSPFNLYIGSQTTSAIRAFGPGLEGGVVNQPNKFTVMCNGESAGLGFLIEGPSEANVQCLDNGDDSALVTYKVTQPGEYAVRVTCHDEDIPNSPYMPIIVEDTGAITPNKLRICGPGVDEKSTSICIGKRAEFYINGLDEAIPPSVLHSLSESNLETVLRANCHDSFGNIVPVMSRLRNDGTVTYEYTPKVTGIHTIYASAANVSLKGVPFRVNVNPSIQPEKVKLWGPGLQAAVWKQPTHFFFDPTDAFGDPTDSALTSQHPISINIVDNRGISIQPRISKQPDNTYLVEYTPNPSSTSLSITPKLGSANTLKSPVRLPVDPDFDLSNIKVQDLESRVYKASYVKFIVDASAIDPSGNSALSAIITSPNNEKSACQIQNNKDGTYTCNYTPLEEGTHQIDITYEGLLVPGSPYRVRVIPGCDPNRVKAYGPGLVNGPHLTPGAQTHFTVDLTGAGQGGLGLTVEGPSQAPIDCQDNRDGTCTVYYTPAEAGAYAIYVRFNDVNVPGSPFQINVKHKLNPKQVHCYGPGLESGLLRAGWPAYFTVDTKNAGEGQLEVMYTPKPGSKLRPASIQPLGGTGEDSSQQQPFHKVTYTPESDGPCRIEVTYDGEHIPGSPFTVNIRKACEPERVRILGAGVEGPVSASLPATFTVDARDAGMGDLTLGLTDPKGQSVPVRVVPLPVDSESMLTNGAVPSVTSLASGDVSDTGLLSCTYEPYMIGPHKIHVMFAGVEVDKSPFVVEIIPTGRADLCRITSEFKEKIAVNREHLITVDTSSGGKGRLTCQAVQHALNQPTSSATILVSETEDNGDGTTSVYYTPTQLGHLNVELRYGGQLIPKGEFLQQVVRPDELTDESIKSVIYRPVQFCLPAPRNKADVEALVIRPNGIQKQVPVTFNDDNTITVVYHPTEPGMHELHVNTYSPVKSNDSRQSTIAMPLQGSPYRFYVDNISTGQVSAHGPGLSHGITSQPAEFTIITKEVGAGGLSISVEGPSKAEIKCVENPDGTCNVSYLPLAPGQYTIAIKFLDQHIAGSPFVAKIAGDILKRSQVSMGAPSDIPLEAFEEDIATLTASVRSVSGREEPCVLKSLPNNRLGISFTPKEVGEHLVSVYQAGQHIANSPFRIRVSEKEIGDPRRVRVSGPGLISGICNKPNQFTVDTRDAGYAGLSLSIEGPSNADIECHDNHDGTCSVIYTPTEPGQYVINVKYADAHVPNSPFCVEIGGEASAKLMERITRRREAAKITHVGSRCELSLRVSDTNPEDLTAIVTSPSGQITRCEVIPIDKEHYNIKFIPQEMGEHLVTVKHKGVQIAGSPFHFTVGPITDGVANKVRAMGSGLQEGWTHELNEFTIYTREAGAGTLSVAIEGPSKAQIDCEERRDGTSYVSYRVALPGIYTCSLKFNDEHIPCSPFRIQVADSSQAKGIVSYMVPTRQSVIPRDMMPTTTEEDTLHIGRPIAFTVHHTENSDYVLRAKVYTPSGTLEEAVVQPIGHDQFVVRFIPHEGGPHLVHVHTVPLEDADDPNWIVGRSSKYRSIHGSPFRLVVSQHAADPGMVFATGEGLRRGKVDMKNTFFVNTTNAGTGVLNVTIEGPSKAQLTTKDHEEGYAFIYTPTVPGIYEITIKYGGNFHISGSPFKAEITGTPRTGVLEARTTDERQSQVLFETVGKSMTGMASTAELLTESTGSRADRVHCHGLGLKCAELDRVNYFTVDASQAGTDVLLVGIYGPKQTSEEVNIKHMFNNQYTISYRIFERGQHILVVKYGNHDVPGSPFILNVS